MNRRLDSKETYEIIKAGILQGTWKPGDRLNKDALARELGRSKTPIREALNRLEGEGYIYNRPYQGYFVTELSVEDVEEITEIRITLEKLALKQSFCAIDHSKITNLLTTLEARRQELVSGWEGDVENRKEVYLELYELVCWSDRVLDEVIKEALQGRWLPRLLDVVQGWITLMRATGSASFAREMQALDDHIRIARSILDNQLEAALQAIECHIRHIAQFIIEDFEKDEEP